MPYVSFAYLQHRLTQGRYGRAIRPVALLLVFLLLVPGYGKGQLALSTDSLLSTLREAEGPQRLRLLHQLSHQFRRTHIDSAVTYAEQAVALSQDLGDRRLLAESRRRLGRLYSMNGRNAEGLEQLRTAEKLFEEAGDPARHALALENLGALYRRQSNYEQALTYYFQALDKREKLEEPGDLQRTLLSIGVIQEELGQLHQGIEFYQRALQISRTRDDPSSIAIVAVQLGNAYAAAGDPDRGIEYMQQALDASDRLPGAHARASVLLEISSLYRNRQSYRQALNANREALKLAKRFNNPTLRTLAQKNMAAVYTDQDQYAAAHTHLLQALETLQAGGSREQVIETRNLLAQNYYAQGDLQQAARHSRRALQEASAVKAYPLGVESLRLLRRVYERLGDSGAALAVQKRLTAFKDSIYRIEQARRIAEMHARYETGQKEKEIALLQKEKEREAALRNAFLAGLVLIGIIGLLVYNRQRLKIKASRTELENRRLKERQLERDLQFRNKQLTTHTLHLVQKNGIMQDLKEQVHEIIPTDDGQANRALRKLQHMVDYSFNLDEDWEQFQLYFEEVHNGFFDTLKGRYPDLTPNELRLAALAKLNMSIKEAAAIMGITPASVKTARYRLRKKLEMETGENLTKFLMALEKADKDQGPPEAV